MKRRFRDVKHMLAEVNASMDYIQYPDEDYDITRPPHVCPVAGGWYRRWNRDARKWIDRKSTRRGDRKFYSDHLSASAGQFTWSAVPERTVQRRDELIAWIFDAARRWLELDNLFFESSIIPHFPLWSLRGSEQHAAGYQEYRGYWDQSTEQLAAVFRARDQHGDIEEEWICAAESCGYSSAIDLVSLDLGPAFVERLRACCWNAHRGRKPRLIHPTTKAIREAGAALLFGWVKETKDGEPEIEFEKDY
ncbi:MAG TPA: hypothetical protein VGE52_08155 [Pirellulales bacterium]